MVLTGKPDEKVSLDDVELLKHTGITAANRKGIYDGDIVRFLHRAEFEIGIVTQEGDEWFIHLPKTGKKIELPWNIKEIEVLVNKLESPDYFSRKLDRRAMKAEILHVISSPYICDKQWQHCRHDLQRAIDKLPKLRKNELIDLVKELAEDVRYYAKAYLDEAYKDKGRK